MLRLLKRKKKKKEERKRKREIAAHLIATYIIIDSAGLGGSAEGTGHKLVPSPCDLLPALKGEVSLLTQSRHYSASQEPSRIRHLHDGV